MIRKRLFALLASLLLIAAPASFASAVSNTTSTPVNLTIAESVSLSLSTNNITLSTTAPSANVTLTTSWVLAPGHTSGKIYAWFTTLPTNSVTAASIGSVFFSTQYNGGAPTFCTQGAFGTGFGLAGENCGVFTLTQNVATDLNDSASTTLTVNFNQQANTAPTVGNYTGGLLNILFSVV